MVNLAWKTLSLDSDVVAAHLQQQIECNGTIMIESKSRRGRRHLRLRCDAGGFYVMVGSKGRDKQRLGVCGVTYLNGEATVFEYTFASVDAFEAEQAAKWDKRFA